MTYGHCCVSMSTVRSVSSSFSKKALLKLVECDNYHRTFKRSTTTYTTTIHRLSLAGVPGSIEPSNVLASIVDDLISKALQEAGYDSEAKFSVSLKHPGFRENGGFHFPPNTLKIVNGHSVMSQISVMLQSNENLHIDKEFTVEVMVFKPPISQPPLKKKRTN